MPYKSFKNKQRWEPFGDKPIISMPPGALQPLAGCSRPVPISIGTGLSIGLICLNKVCYDTYIKPSGCKFVKLYYEPDMRRIAFEARPTKAGDYVFAISPVKPGFLAIIRAKTFLDYFGIKYREQHRSYPVHQTSRSSGLKGIEIKLDGYIPDQSR